MQRNETQTRSVSHGDWLTCQKSGQYLQAFRNKVLNFAKNHWSLTKLKLSLQVIPTDLHAKNTDNTYKHLEKKSGKLFDRWNLLSPKPIISPKVDGA